MTEIRGDNEETTRVAYVTRQYPAVHGVFAWRQRADENWHNGERFVRHSADILLITFTNNSVKVSRLCDCVCLYVNVVNKRTFQTLSLCKADAFRCYAPPRPCPLPSSQTRPLLLSRR